MCNICAFMAYYTGEFLYDSWSIVACYYEINLLVEDISATILSHHGNWLSSNLSHLAGHFAGIIEAAVPEEHLQELQDALHGLPHLEVRIERGSDILPEVSTEQINFVITGNDRPGRISEPRSIRTSKCGKPCKASCSSCKCSSGTAASIMPAK
jgi:hypothetical protein